MQDSKRDTDVKNSLLDSVGEGKGGIIWKNGIETYILSKQVDHQSRFDKWDRVLRAGALGWPKGMGWEGGGSGVQGGEHMCTHGWFMSMYGKTH